jgi:polysaccharide pyruvyl transferase WcaK-like protein
LIVAERARIAAVTGTFDVQNYGDVLFPLVAAHRLNRHGIEILPLSPTGLPTGWSGTMASTNFAAILDYRQSIDGILIGGGNIVHVGPANLQDYKLGNLFGWAYAGLWLGATIAAAIRNVPVIWNAPGVPTALPEPLRQHIMMKQSLQAAAYVSVRDAASAENLGNFADVKVAVVPDTALDVAQLWPKAHLADMFASMLDRKAAPSGGTQYLTVHAKARSLDVPPNVLAGWIDDFAAARGMTPLLVALGPCHDDDVTARQIGRFLRSPHIVLDDPLGIEEIAAAIAHAGCYVGSSLHGYITAAAYAVPSVLVTKPDLPKFHGFTAHLGRERDLAPDWGRAFETAASYVGASRPRAIPASVFAQLDQHWDRIAKEINQPSRRMVEQARFLRSYMQHSISHGGWDWALAQTCK